MLLKQNVDYLGMKIMLRQSSKARYFVARTRDKSPHYKKKVQYKAFGVDEAAENFSVAS